MRVSRQGSNRRIETTLPLRKGMGEGADQRRTGLPDLPS